MKLKQTENLSFSPDKNIRKNTKPNINLDMRKDRIPEFFQEHDGL